MKTCLLSFIVLLFCITTKAQDTILQMDGTKVLAIVLSIDNDFVMYKSVDGNTDNIYKMDKDGVSRIDYKDGKSVIFQTATIIHPEMLDMDRKGYLDAKKHYKQSRGPGAGTFFATVFGSPILGLVPAIITSSNTPPMDRLNYPSDSLMENEVYKQAYVRTAKHKKQGRVWLNYGVGSIINVAVGIGVGVAVALSQIQGL